MNLFPWLCGDCKPEEPESDSHWMQYQEQIKQRDDTIEYLHREIQQLRQILSTSVLSEEFEESEETQQYVWSLNFDLTKEQETDYSFIAPEFSTEQMETVDYRKLQRSEVRSVGGSNIPEDDDYDSSKRDPSVSRSLEARASQKKRLGKRVGRTPKVFRHSESLPAITDQYDHSTSLTSPNDGISMATLFTEQISNPSTAAVEEEEEDGYSIPSFRGAGGSLYNVPIDDKKDFSKKMTKLFQKYDADNSSLDADDINFNFQDQLAQLYIQDRELDVESDDSEWGVLFKKIDENNDGEISSLENMKGTSTYAVGDNLEDFVTDFLDSSEFSKNEGMIGVKDGARQNENFSGKGNAECGDVPVSNDSFGWAQASSKNFMTPGPKDLYLVVRGD